MMMSNLRVRKTTPDIPPVAKKLMAVDPLHWKFIELWTLKLFKAVKHM